MQHDECGDVALVPKMKQKLSGAFDGSERKKAAPSGATLTCPRLHSISFSPHASIGRDMLLHTHIHNAHLRELHS